MNTRIDQLRETQQDPQTCNDEKLIVKERETWKVLIVVAPNEKNSQTKRTVLFICPKLQTLI